MERKQKATPLQSLLLCALFAALIAVGALIRVPGPGVPFTLQTLAVILSGLLLGPRRGAVAAGVYLGLGLSGVPVFTGGGGIPYLFKLSFGYILGFVPGAYIAGALAGKVKKARMLRLFGSGLAGIGVVYLFGVGYQALLLGVGNQAIDPHALLVNGFLITLPGDVIKCLGAALLALRLRPVLAELA